MGARVIDLSALPAAAFGVLLGIAAIRWVHGRLAGPCRMARRIGVLESDSTISVPRSGERFSQSVDTGLCASSFRSERRGSTALGESNSSDRLGGGWSAGDRLRTGLRVSGGTVQEAGAAALVPEPDGRVAAADDADLPTAQFCAAASSNLDLTGLRRS